MAAYRARMLASALTVVAVGVPTSALPAQASSTRMGELTICVSGAHGKYSKVTVQRDDRAVQVFGLSGCATRRLPVGRYVVVVRAPVGFHVFGVSGGSGTIGSANGGQISAEYRDRWMDRGRQARHRAFAADEGDPHIRFGLRRVG